MGRRADTRTLSLRMNGAHVGAWSRTQYSPDTLPYDPNWVKSHEGRPLLLPFTPGNTPQLL